MPAGLHSIGEVTETVPSRSITLLFATSHLKSKECNLCRSTGRSNNDICAHRESFDDDRENSKGATASSDSIVTSGHAELTPAPAGRNSQKTLHNTVQSISIVGHALWRPYARRPLHDFAVSLVGEDERVLTHAMIVPETSVDLHWFFDTVTQKGCHSNGERLYRLRGGGRLGAPARWSSGGARRGGRGGVAAGCWPLYAAAVWHGRCRPLHGRNAAQTPPPRRLCPGLV